MPSQRDEQLEFGDFAGKCGETFPKASIIRHPR